MESAIIEKSTRKRISSIDILRGLVIILMAVDHIRDMWALEPFAPENIAETTPGYFFTRWITHFCAPVFVFLAGTSIYLYLQKVKDKKLVSSFLVKRGIWLILIEVVIINWAWSWKMLWNSWGFFLQVIWAIGVAMIAMALLIRLSNKILFAISILIIAGHNLLNFIVPKDLETFDWFWKIFHEQGWISFTSDNSFGMYIVYPILPWIGVMAAGFVFGQVMLWSPERRIKLLWRLGLGCILLFIVLRFTNIYGDTGVWETQKSGLYTLMDFLNVQKYPPSLLFLLMTLGPSFLLLLLFEKWKTKIFDFLKVFGRVPFFFYILHFPVIHFSSMLYYRITEGAWFDLANSGGPKNWPEYYQPSLLRLYLVWIAIVIFFYFLCKWYNDYKSRKDYWWLKYI
jgi:uncharacterized membrane protein